MKIKIINALSAFVCAILFACNNGREIDASQIDSVIVYAMPKGSEFSHGIHSFSELMREARDSTITNRVFIRRVVHEINQLDVAENRCMVDAKVGLILYHKNGERTYLLMGEFGGICYNGKRMKERKSLHRLIDQTVYSPHSNEYWFYPDRARDEIKSAKKSIREISKKESLKR